MTSRILNFTELNRSPLRSDALAIVERAYAAIDTEAVVRSKLRYEDNILTVDGRAYDLSKFKRVRLLGFGKASCKAVQTVESIMRARLTDGIAIDVRAGVCEIVSIREGTHPQPSSQNVVATEKVVDIAKDSAVGDLVIVVVSGGGSSLLCWPQDECDQSSRLYDDAMRVGLRIKETNIIRRHLSAVKGGGLVEFLHPATVIGLVFCDVPGDSYGDVASGPTFFDETTIADAQRILQRHGLEGYTLRETPKDRSLFDKVQNVGMISNTAALAMMQETAKDLGYQIVDAGSDRYEESGALVASMRSQLNESVAVIAGGEVQMKISGARGKGGRCQYVGLEALKNIQPGDIFVSFASDGIDNCEAAGVIADSLTLQKVRDLNISIDERLARFDTFDFFEAAGDLIYTGFTDANVSDLYFTLRKNI